MSTRYELQKRALGAGWPSAGARRAGDPAEEVALVARAKRELLLRVHRHRLRAEDLERLARELTPDQRLILAYQLALDRGCREAFCSRFGWSRPL